MPTRTGGIVGQLAGRVTEEMSWDSTRPVPWQRFLKEGLFCAVGMSSELYVLAGPRDPDLYPSQRLHPVDGTVTWLLDAAAHSQL